MILQALTEYCRVLADRGVLEAPGWSSAKISFALCLSADGTLEQVISLQTEQPRGKKLVVAPQLVPSLPARSSVPAACLRISFGTMPAIFWGWTTKESPNAP